MCQSDGMNVGVKKTRPREREWRRATKNGKYKCCVLKVQMACDHMGRPIWFTGPHLGVSHDSKLFEQSPPPLDMARGERWLADAAYVAWNKTGHVITGFKKPRGGSLSSDQSNFNRVHGWYRATIEHLNAWVKHFRILGSIFRGHLRNIQFLANVVQVIINTAALSIETFPLRLHRQIVPMDIASSSPVINDPVIDENKVDNDTGFHWNDFEVGEPVLFWSGLQWKRGKIKYISKIQGTLQIRYGKGQTVSGILPHLVSPFYGDLSVLPCVPSFIQLSYLVIACRRVNCTFL